VAKVTMPQLGESVAEGTIGKWLKQPGDHVAKYEPLLEVITDKVNAEVPSPFEGILLEILAEEGATVPNDAEIAIIETAEGDAPAATGPVVTSNPAPKPSFDPADGPAGSDERPVNAPTPPPASAPVPAARPAANCRPGTSTTGASPSSAATRAPSSVADIASRRKSACSALRASRHSARPRSAWRLRS